MLLDGTPTGLEPYVASIKSLFFTLLLQRRLLPVRAAFIDKP
jgi:hypothetical protein